MNPASVSVVVPVRDGERYLEELLAALAEQGQGLEILVIDSGSRDRSREIARAAGVDLLEIAPADFGHGRTRNLGAERTSGELICFLTQDATPRPGWLAAYREAFGLAERVGAAYGPHLPRPDTSPMIARELVEFFATFGTAPTLQGAGGPSFLSNVNACYARACWAEIGFRDVAYSEDQAFGADLLAAGWVKVYHPGAAVLHAHDYRPTEFMRRYFDEYRGLREAIGHVEPIGLRAGAGDVRRLVGADVRWMAARGYGRSERARWGGRALVHHGGRKVFSALGSRAGTLPAGVQRRLSLEGRVVGPPPPVTAAAAAAPPEPAAPPARPMAHIPQHRPGHPYDPIAHLFREGPAPLRRPVTGMSGRECLHLAFVIPPFGIGSGGHNIIFQLVDQLERRGHTCSIWVFDPFEERANEWPAVMRHTVVEHFARVRAPLHKGFEHWRGADVVVATGWQTVYAALALEGARARAYLINDHEPEFYSTSVESRWAELTYRMGLYGICGSPWLAGLYAERYGGVGGSFQYGVDHSVYRPLAVGRRPDTVVFYARAVTGRRAVALGVMALAELHARRPDVRIVMFGDRDPMPAAFPYEHLGVASAQELARVYNEASVGLCLSLTNYSLIPQEMLACGLPCVDLLGASAESVFGGDGPVTLVPFDSDALAGALEELLDDEELRRRRAEQGIAFVAGNSWAAAAGQVEGELRAALRLREGGRELPAPALWAAGSASAGPFARGPEALGPGDLGRLAPPIRVAGAGEPVSERLFERLGDEDLAAVEAALDPDERWLWDAWPPERRRVLTLAYGVHHGVPGVLERTGLSATMPPEEVHAMARDVLAAGGGYWYADLVGEALRGAGADLAAVGDGLDFGASSGRVIRVLAAAYPEARWTGCDPNEPAIAWAAANLPGIDFFVSPQDPPLPVADGAFDLVFAISVWSHYGRGAALAWLEEMARVVRPGGHLVLTTHGSQSVSYYAEQGTRATAQLLDIVKALHREGFWFKAEFGPDGDWGVVHPEWGTAFLTPEWLLSQLGGRWHVAHFMPGYVEGNQDVYVLRRVPPAGPG
ncbi:MAG: hypothetical protein QOF77_1710 [Solirubrobacteraceae bacterium]|nr:hypothetical protein [Solirubrobacteraceae bacterium]